MGDEDTAATAAVTLRTSSKLRSTVLRVRVKIFRYVVADLRRAEAMIQLDKIRYMVFKINIYIQMQRSKI